MARNFTTTISYQQQSLRAVLIPMMLPNGRHYEINIQGYPRFYMAWCAMGRFDIIADSDGEIPNIPYEIVLAISDVLAQVSC